MLHVRSSFIFVMQLIGSTMATTTKFAIRSRNVIIEILDLKRLSEGNVETFVRQLEC